LGDGDGGRWADGISIITTGPTAHHDGILPGPFDIDLVKTALSRSKVSDMATSFAGQGTFWNFHHNTIPIVITTTLVEHEKFSRGQKHEPFFDTS
jgi:hypothetical protein